MNNYAEFLKREERRARPRTPGSCRFSPYYKAQWYDPETMAWRDVPERFTTPNKARARFNDGFLWRVMEVSMSGRDVV